MPVDHHLRRERQVSYLDGEEGVEVAQGSEEDQEPDDVPHGREVSRAGVDKCYAKSSGHAHQVRAEASRPTLDARTGGASPMAMCAVDPAYENWRVHINHQ